MLIYHNEVPDFLRPFLAAPALRRLGGVGMNCGCEYTSFRRFYALPGYSRLDHSLGCALIVWHFTAERAPTLAALFHDAASPVFAHSVDFMRGDYLSQESTEEGLEALLKRDKAIADALAAGGLGWEQVVNYRLYPIADNPSPRLSSDRLEYTLGNALRYGLADEGTLQGYYNDITVAAAEDGAPELAFQTESAAAGFGRTALACSRIYVSEEDRYSMQRLSELLRDALTGSVLTPEDLYRTEPEVIARLEAHPLFRRRWRDFRGLREILRGDEIPPGEGRVIPAKKRYINPLLAGRGRLADLDSDFGRALREYLAEPQDTPLGGR